MVDSVKKIPNKIAELTSITIDSFNATVCTQGLPVVFKGLVKDWPYVKAANQSIDEIADIIKKAVGQKTVHLSVLKNVHKGQFFFNSDTSGFNFSNYHAPLSDAMDWLLANRAEETADSLYIQSLSLAQMIPDFTKTHPMPLLGETIIPNMWIGNSLKTQTHFDFSSNIACLVSGKRRFTLFPPDQMKNLYTGPFDMTPGGVPLSMVSFSDPDFEKYPLYHKALETASFADLEAGDAIYIPYGWWHHVESQGPLNILINYWWNSNRVSTPLSAFYAAILTMRDLPENEKSVWKGVMDQYIFGDHRAHVAHLPTNAQGILGPLSPQHVSQLKTSIKRFLGI